MSTMMRWDIINHLIKKNNYKTYLEIGYYKGWSFDRVECHTKIAVDPQPSKYSVRMSHEYPILEMGKIPFNEPREVVIIGTSDEYFRMQDSLGKVIFDIIFIDGDHHSQQVDKDIQNALKHLSEEGTIVLHDCNPPTELHSTTGTSNGEWCGTVYQSFANFKRENTGYDMYVIDIDFGVGIIKRGNPLSIVGKIIRESLDTSWDYFDKNRKELLNLISPKEFLEREK